MGEKMIYFKRLTKEATVIAKKYEGHAGFDCFSCEDYELDPLERHSFALGFAVEIPHGTVLLVCEKSGMAQKDGIMTIGNVIDATYRGECHVILVNLSNNVVYIKKYQKIAQMLLIMCATKKDIVQIVSKLSETERGDGGFGSTGQF